MRIIEQGDIERTKEPIVKFKCFECGCVFEANSLEYDSRPKTTFNEIGGETFLYTEYTCRCPICKNTVREYD